MNTLFVGKVQYSFDELPSTNDFALDLVAQKANIIQQIPPEGTVVRAASQSAGRGQYGSRWHAAAFENLTLSIILYPVWLPLNRQFYLSMAISLGLFDCIGYFAETLNLKIPINIKWPNDLYIGKTKVAGILIQNILQQQRIQAAVVGIGLNVNQQIFDPLLPNPGAMAQHMGQHFDLDKVASALFYFLEKRYLQLKNKHLDQIKSDYESRLLGFGKELSFTQLKNSYQFSATVKGVNTEGNLCLDRAGELLYFDLKEIKWNLS